MTLGLSLGGGLPLLILLAEVAFQLLVAGWVLLRRPRYRSSTLAWVLIVIVLPLFGALAYLAFGEVRLGKRRLRRYFEIRKRVHDSCMPHWSGSDYPDLSDAHQPIATLAESVVDTVPRGGNTVELIGDTDIVIERLIADIDEARLHCHLLFYIYLDDETGRRVAAALERAARRGVACRLLVDAVGSRDFLDCDLAAELRNAGVQVVAALPANLVRALFARLDLRNHRKVAVVDGCIGYTGSQNIADASYAPRKDCAPWVDAMVRVCGPVVRDLQEIFVIDWYLDADEPLEELLSAPVAAPVGVDLEAGLAGVPIQVMATGPGSVNEAMVQIILTSLHMAREEVIMTTPYFVPDEATMSALISAARRGVDTILVVPEANDSRVVQLASRSYFQELLDAGVKIHEFTEGLLHAKTMTVDRNLALVSTANLDRRSFELNFEVSTLVYDTDFASQLRLLQKHYLDDSRRIDAVAWRRRGWTRRIVENLAGTFSAVL